MTAFHHLVFLIARTLELLALCVGGFAMLVWG